MPDFRSPLSPEELKKRRGRTTRVDLEPYREYLSTIEPGYAGYLYLGDNETKPTIKRRVSMTAAHLNMKIKYLRSDANELLFEVLPSE
jgi:hypothetical protein